MSAFRVWNRRFHHNLTLRGDGILVIDRDHPAGTLFDLEADAHAAIALTVQHAKDVLLGGTSAEANSYSIRPPEPQADELLAAYDDLMRRASYGNPWPNYQQNETAAAYGLVGLLKARGLWEPAVWEIVEGGLYYSGQLGAGDLMRRSRARFQAALRSHFAGEAAEAAS